jgi:ABC-type Fe3+ transport system substrate-binding protein
MNMINKNNTINEIAENHPTLIAVFENAGMKGLDNPHILKQMGALTIEKICTMKKIGVDVFVELLNETLDHEQSSDVTLNKQIHVEGKTNVLGLLPCPVRLPMLEELNKWDGMSDVNAELKAASEGLDWLKDEVMASTNADNLADVFISAGFDLFFEEDLMKKYKDQKVFRDFTGIEHFNKDFENAEISLKDPSGDYSMLAVVPAVFLVNTQILGDRPIPKTWADLMDPMYEKSVSLPVSDFDLFNAILIHIQKEFGDEGVKKLGRSLIQSMHPAQMVKSEKGKKRVKPAVSIMPYFFTKMALPGSVMQAVWPEDGAIISPIFMLTKEESKDQVSELASIMASKEMGELLSHQGLFPSVHPEVDNNLEGKSFKWVGWDYINSNNIGQLLSHCMNVFEEGMK